MLGFCRQHFIDNPMNYRGSLSLLVQFFVWIYNRRSGVLPIKQREDRSATSVSSPIFIEGGAKRSYGSHLYCFDRPWCSCAGTG